VDGEVDKEEIHPAPSTRKTENPSEMFSYLKFHRAGQQPERLVGTKWKPNFTNRSWKGTYPGK